jgi:uncharacterized surface protein with fasciclin (FAS1) repeats
MGKLLETIITHRIQKMLEDAKWFSPNQAGFRSNKSTMDNLSDLVAHAELTSRTNEEGMLLVLLDLRRAFDNVPP